MPEIKEKRWIIEKKLQGKKPRWYRVSTNQTFVLKSHAELVIKDYIKSEGDEWRATPCTVTTTWASPGGAK